MDADRYHHPHHRTDCGSDPPPTSQKVFTSIKELRDAAQTNSLKHDDVVVKFDDSNPTTVVAVMKHADPNIKDEKFINSFFIVDNSKLLLSAKHSDLKFDLLICRTADYIHVYPHVYRRKNCLLSRNQANWGTFQST